MIAMVLSAGMGLFQEVTYKKYGKQWKEGLFYTVSSGLQNQKLHCIQQMFVALSCFAFLFVLLQGLTNSSCGIQQVSHDGYSDYHGSSTSDGFHQAIIA